MAKILIFAVVVTTILCLAGNLRAHESNVKSDHGESPNDSTESVSKPAEFNNRSPRPSAWSKDEMEDLRPNDDKNIGNKQQSKPLSKEEFSFWDMEQLLQYIASFLRTSNKNPDEFLDKEKSENGNKNVIETNRDPTDTGIRKNSKDDEKMLNSSISGILNKSADDEKIQDPSHKHYKYGPPKHSQNKMQKDNNPLDKSTVYSKNKKKDLGNYKPREESKYNYKTEMLKEDNEKMKDRSKKNSVINRTENSQNEKQTNKDLLDKPNVYSKNKNLDKDNPENESKNDFKTEIQNTDNDKMQNPSNKHFAGSPTENSDNKMQKDKYPLNESIAYSKIKNQNSNKYNPTEESNNNFKNDMENPINSNMKKSEDEKEIQNSPLNNALNKSVNKQKQQESAKNDYLDKQSENSKNIGQRKKSTENYLSKLMSDLNDKKQNQDLLRITYKYYEDDALEEISSYDSEVSDICEEETNEYEIYFDYEDDDDEDEEEEEDAGDEGDVNENGNESDFIFEDNYVAKISDNDKNTQYADILDKKINGNSNISSNFMNFVTPSERSNTKSTIFQTNDDNNLLTESITSQTVVNKFDSLPRSDITNRKFIDENVSNRLVKSPKDKNQRLNNSDGVSLTGGNVKHNINSTEISASKHNTEEVNKPLDSTPFIIKNPKIQNISPYQPQYANDIFEPKENIFPQMVNNDGVYPAQISMNNNSTQTSQNTFVPVDHASKKVNSPQNPLNSFVSTDKHAPLDNEDRKVDEVAPLSLSPFQQISYHSNHQPVYFEELKNTNPDQFFLIDNSAKNKQNKGEENRENGNISPIKFIPFQSIPHYTNLQYFQIPDKEQNMFIMPALMNYENNDSPIFRDTEVPENAYRSKSIDALQHSSNNFFPLKNEDYLNNQYNFQYRNAPYINNRENQAFEPNQPADLHQDKFSNIQYVTDKNTAYSNSRDKIIDFTNYRSENQFNLPLKENTIPNMGIPSSNFISDNMETNPSFSQLYNQEPLLQNTENNLNKMDKIMSPGQLERKKAQDQYNSDETLNSQNQPVYPFSQNNSPAEQVLLSQNGTETLLLENESNNKTFPRENKINSKLPTQEKLKNTEFSLPRIATSNSERSHLHSDTNLHKESGNRRSFSDDPKSNMSKLASLETKPAIGNLDNNESPKILDFGESNESKEDISDSDSDYNESDISDFDSDYNENDISDFDSDYNENDISDSDADYNEDDMSYDTSNSDYDSQYEEESEESVSFDNGTIDEATMQPNQNFSVHADTNNANESPRSFNIQKNDTSSNQKRNFNSILEYIYKNSKNPFFAAIKNEKS